MAVAFVGGDKDFESYLFGDSFDGGFYEIEEKKEIFGLVFLVLELFLGTFYLFIGDVGPVVGMLFMTLPCYVLEFHSVKDQPHILAML